MKEFITWRIQPLGMPMLTLVMALASCLHTCCDLASAGSFYAHQPIVQSHALAEEVASLAPYTCISTGKKHGILILNAVNVPIQSQGTCTRANVRIRSSWIAFDEPHATSRYYEQALPKSPPAVSNVRIRRGWMRRAACDEPMLRAGFADMCGGMVLKLRGGGRGHPKATAEEYAEVEGIELTDQQSLDLRRHWKKKPEWLEVKKEGVQKLVKTKTILNVMKDRDRLEQVFTSSYYWCCSSSYYWLVAPSSTTGRQFTG